MQLKHRLRTADQDLKVSVLQKVPQLKEPGARRIVVGPRSMDVVSQKSLLDPDLFLIPVIPLTPVRPWKFEAAFLLDRLLEFPISECSSSIVRSWAYFKSSLRLNVFQFKSDVPFLWRERILSGAQFDLKIEDMVHGAFRHIGVAWVDAFWIRARQWGKSIRGRGVDHLLCLFLY